MQRAGAEIPAERVPGVLSGWSELDEFLGRDSGVPGLARGVLHEWLGVANASARRRDAWTPPLMVLTHLAQRAFVQRLQEGRDAVVMWIGRSVWPYPRALVQAYSAATCDVAEGVESALVRFGFSLQPASNEFDGATFLDRSIFIDPRDVGERLWAIDVALRSRAVAVAVCDASRMPLASTRRLQLAARSNDALALLARPAWECSELTCASTRFLVERRPSTSRESFLNWSVDLLRAKTVQLRSEHVS